MKLTEAILIKKRYQYILQDASLPELIEADNLSIEALKRIYLKREHPKRKFPTLLSGETTKEET